MSHELTRRRFLSSATATAGIAGIGLATTACSTGPSQGNSTSENVQVKLPKYIPFQGVKPDLAGNDNGLSAGYITFPADPKPSVDEPPGTGSTYTVLAPSVGAIPPGVDKNQYWQELNKRLKSNLVLNAVPNADYDKKVATIVAGDDLPDSMMLNWATPRLPGLLASKYQDLTEFVSGDAIKEYPHLANIPTASWVPTVYNGGIYGIPIPRPKTGQTLYKRTDLIAEKGLDPNPTNFDELRALAKGLTDPARNRWGLARPLSILAYVGEMLRLPNTWKEQDGKFTRVIELDEYKKAIDAVASMAKDGSFHPDAFSGTIAQAKQWVLNGATAISRDGFTAWTFDVWATSPKLQQTLDAFGQIGFDGGEGVAWEPNLDYALHAFKKAEPGRIKELLRIANWLAAPFGTEEYLYRKFGLPNVHHTLQGTDPVLTDKGGLETTLSVKYITDSPLVIYMAGLPEVTKRQYAYNEKVADVFVKNPAIGLYSETENNKGAALNKAVESVALDIMQGRKKLSEFDTAIETWRKNGGDAIRKEFEDSFAATQ